MKSLALLAIGATLGVVGLMLFAQQAAEKPVAETPTIHTSYRPIPSTAESVQTETSSKCLASKKSNPYLEVERWV